MAIVKWEGCRQEAHLESSSPANFQTEPFCKAYQPLKGKYNTKTYKKESKASNRSLRSREGTEKSKLKIAPN